MLTNILNINGNVSLGQSTEGDGILISNNSTIQTKHIDKNGSLNYFNGNVTAINDYAIYEYNSNLGRQWSSLPNLPCTTDKIMRAGLSSNAQVILITTWYTQNLPRIHYVSNDCGVSWSQVTGLDAGTRNIFNIVMSIDGKYQYVRIENDIYKSLDYGNTFTKVSFLSDIRASLVDTDSTGQYVIVTSDFSKGNAVSKDYGTTWNFFDQTSNTNWTACVSYDGTHMYLLSSLGVIKKSSDYGTTWSQIYQFTNVVGTGGIGCNGDGKNIYVGALNFNDNTSSLTCRRSLDGGIIWETLSMSSGVYGQPFINYTGNYIFVQAGGNNLAAFSNDCGKTWSYIPSTVNNIAGGALTFSFDKSVSYGFNLLYQNSNNGLKVTTKNDFLIPTQQPLVASNGSVYFNNIDNSLYIYNGSTWRRIATV
jgi:hypothetical protein